MSEGNRRRAGPIRGFAVVGIAAGLAAGLLAAFGVGLPERVTPPGGSAAVDAGAPPVSRSDVAPSGTAEGSPDCHYATWTWDTRARRSVGHREVATWRERLPPEAIHAPTGCSVCREDQAWITLQGLPPLAVCRYVAEDVRWALGQALAASFPIQSLVAYRVGRSRGPVDAAGLRTRFSNHSFGIAVDVNAERNGLYSGCVRFGPSCTLLRGGPWRPGLPGAVTRESPVYRAFREIGWHWGGELPGRQKDFMHFSLTGD